MRVPCEVRETTVLFNDRRIDGIEVTCTRCEFSTTSGGTGDGSVRRCLALLRENCPRDERNYYVEDEDAGDD